MGSKLSTRRWWFLALPLAGLAAVAIDGNAASRLSLGDEPVLREVEDEFDTVYEEEWQDGKPVSMRRGKIGDRFLARPLEKEVKEQPPRVPERLHPLVEQWLREKDPREFVELVISTPETLQIPRFPEPDVTLDRKSRVNAYALETAQKLADDLMARRSEQNKAMGARIERMGGKMMEEFWLLPAVQVALPLGAVKELLADERILYIEPVQTQDYPPANGNANDDVDDARAHIQSDAYFNQGLTSGWIGLLDTGVHRTHELLSGPNRIALWRDCTSGNATCTGGNPDDTCWNHGTSAAGIISGNNNQGNPQRGVTGIMIDSWKVYPDTTDAAGNCTGGLNTTATVRAFQQAVVWLDRIIVAEMQGSGSESSAISVAADAAFDAGSAVIAANGNNGPAASTVNSPANAHKVIGVGAFGTESGTQYANQSRGPTADSRFKPDIQTPNNSETASTGCAFGVPCAPLSNTANRVFGGTSGAVPYGGAAAALARNWMLRFGVADPGHVYARLILAGQDPYPFDNTVGAGRIKLPVNGYSWWGKVSIGHHETIEIPLGVSRASANNLDGSLWWPEALTGHNDIDLSIVSPTGAVFDTSLSVNSVFERARAAGGVATGTWKLRIYGYSVSGRQTVYYGATVRN
jgi:serine protease AprX